MNPDSYLNADKFIREEWFQDHVAEDTRTLDGAFELIKWKRPKNNNYLVMYILVPGYLIVTGDVGDAIYSSGLTTFKQWADCDITYFAGKCVASENGRQYREWDNDFLRDKVKEALKQSSDKSWKDREWDNDFLRDKVKEALKQSSDKSWKDLEDIGGSLAMSSEHEWIGWLTEYGNEFFGPDRYCWPADGKIIAMRCKAHLIGLKMAVEQLKETI